MKQKALPNQWRPGWWPGKLSQRELVLRMVRDEGCATATDVVEETGLPLGNATCCLHRLYQQGYVARSIAPAFYTTASGRRPWFYEVIGC